MIELTNLLFYLREIILQNSVVLQQQFHDNVVWTHSVFQYSVYQPYARQMDACLTEGESPNQLSIVY